MDLHGSFTPLHARQIIKNSAPRKPIRRFTPSEGEGEAKITFMFTHKRHMYSTLRHTGEEVKEKKEKQLTRARENGGVFRPIGEVSRKRSPLCSCLSPHFAFPRPKAPIAPSATWPDFDFPPQTPRRPNAAPDLSIHSPNDFLPR